MIWQKEFIIGPYSRGFHLITREVESQFEELPDTGLLHLFIKHTSSALCINENADPSVLADFESVYNHLVPENLSFLTHTLEGPDDMPAHIKASMIGSSVQVPLSRGHLNFGTWQGIYLCEFRNRASARHLVATIYS